VEVLVEGAFDLDGGAVVVAVQALALVAFVADEMARAEDEMVLGDTDFEALGHGASSPPPPRVRRGSPTPRSARVSDPAFGAGLRPRRPHDRRSPGLGRNWRPSVGHRRGRRPAPNARRAPRGA